MFGCINLTRSIFHAMKARRAGVIVNVIGYAGERLLARYIIGTTGNAALMAFSRSVGSQAPDFGVRVVAVMSHPDTVAVSQPRRLAEREFIICVKAPADGLRWCPWRLRSRLIRCILWASPLAECLTHAQTYGRGQRTGVMTQHGIGMTFCSIELEVVQKAIAHYSKLCNRELKKGKHAPFRGHSITIKWIQTKLGNATKGPLEVSLCELEQLTLEAAHKSYVDAVEREIATDVNKPFRADVELVKIICEAMERRALAGHSHARIGEGAKEAPIGEA